MRLLGATAATFAGLFVSAASMGSSNTQDRDLLLDCATTFPPTLIAQDLGRRFGASNVRRDSIHVGEGEFVRGTVLFANMPRRRVEITWKDTVTMQSPELVIVRSSPSDWHTTSGVSTGLGVRELETINGRPFRMLGYEVDGGGAVTSWEGGSLDALQTSSCRLGARLDSLIVEDDSARALLGRVTGPQTFSSSHPAIRALNPRVAEFFLSFRGR